MWLVLSSCLSPSTTNRESGNPAGTDTAHVEQTDDSGLVATDDSAVGDDSEPPGTDDSAIPAVDDSADPDVSASCDWMTWENVGQPYFKTWCTACHSSDLPEEKRQGAPMGCNLDTYADVVAWSPDIQAKLLAGTMPPTGTPPQDLEHAVLDWLECGAPR
jgi:hypothetical protein